MAEARDDQRHDAHDAGVAREDSNAVSSGTLRRAMAIVGDAILSRGDAETIVRDAAQGDEALLEECLSLLSADRASYPPLDAPEPLEGTAAELPSALNWLRSNPPGHLGGFAVRELLGSGATALVYRGWERETGGEVAIKVVPCPPGQDSLAARFESEVAVLRQLWHPGIVRIFATGVESMPTARLCWMAMELVPGVPITEHARKNLLTPRSAVELVMRFCDAVACAHQHGVIHRDLKPANLLVTSSAPDAQPAVKVVDFGLAHVFAPSAAATARLSRRTLAGTLSYIAPEQISRGESDVRSDVYSLAAVLYELLAGRPAIELTGQTMVEALRSVLRPAIPRLLRAVPGIGRALDAVVHKGLAIDPDARYASVHDFVADLERALEGFPTTAKSASSMEYLRLAWRTRPVLVAAVMTSLVSLSIGLVVVAFSLNRAEKAEASLRVKTDELQDLLAYLTSDSVGSLAQLPASSTIRSSMLSEFERRLRNQAANLGANSTDAPKIRRAYARVLDGLGDVAMERGHLDETSHYRARVLDLLSPFAATAGDTHAELRADYSLGLVKRGDIQRRLGDIADTAKCYREALSIDKSLARLQPHNRRFQDNLVRSYTRLSSDDLGTTPEDQVELTRQAFALAEQLLARDPANLTSAHAVVEASAFYCRALNRTGQTAQAVAVIATGLREGQRICRERPADRVYARDFSLAVLAAHELRDAAALINLDEARRESFVMLDAIALLTPDDHDWLAENNAARLRLGDALVAQGRLRDATQVYLGGLRPGRSIQGDDLTSMRQRVEFATRLLDLRGIDSIDTGLLEDAIARTLAILLERAQSAAPPHAAEASTLRTLLQLRHHEGVPEAGILAAIERTKDSAWSSLSIATLARTELLIALRRHEEARATLLGISSQEPGGPTDGYRSLQWLEAAILRATGQSSPP